MGDEVPGLAFGAITEFVTALTDAVREELNMFAPEIAQWWSTPAMPYGPARVRKDNHPSLGLLPNKWFDVVGGIIESAVDWCDRVVVVCATLEQAQVLRDHLPLLREFGREVVFCYVPLAEVTDDLVEQVAEAILENLHSPGGELMTAP